MLSKTVKAATTATDKGEFTAIAAAYTVDRMNDQIMPGAFAATIGAWQRSGKQIPLHWDHGGDPSDIIGTVDPAQMREADEGLYVKGKLDIENSEMAREAWRVMKENAVGLSFGYLVQDETKNEDTGVVELKALDLFEITITPAPANPDTKLLSLKNAESTDESLSRDYEALAFRLATDGISPQASASERVWLTVEEAKSLKEASEAFPADEIEGALSGDLKAVWTAAYVNDLPDGAFLYVEPGGTKDADGKTTPRTLRHFPYKDASGAVDLPHLRNALARIPQSSLSQDVKDRLTSKAQGILDNANKGADAQEPLVEATAKASDSLSKGYEKVMYRLQTHGITPEAKSPPVEEPSPEGPSLDELARHHDQIMFRLLTNR